MKKMDTIRRDKPKYPEQKLHITLPPCPSVNHMYVNTRGGGKRLTKEAERFFNNMQQVVRNEVITQNWKFEEGDVWFVVECDFYMKDNRIRDTHNMFKIMLDILEGIVFKNDYFVKPRVYEVELDREEPRVEITIYPEKMIK